MTDTPHTDIELLATYEFKGHTIKKPSFARRALALNLVNLQAPKFLDIAAFIFALVCPRNVLEQTASGDRGKFNKEFFRWVDLVKFTEDDAEEAGKLVERVLADSKKGAAEPVNIDMADDPN